MTRLERNNEAEIRIVPHSRRQDLLLKLLQEPRLPSRSEKRVTITRTNC